MQKVKLSQKLVFSGIHLVLLLAAGFFSISASAKEPALVTLEASATSANIQKALDNLPAGGEVVLSKGTYEISEPLFLRHDDQTLRGSGLGTVLHLADGAECPVVVIAPRLKNWQRGVSHIRLADLAIDGNRKNQHVERWTIATDGSTINNNGIQVSCATDVAIDQVTAFRCRSGGLVTANVKRLHVTGFESYDNHFDGLACYITEDSVFSDLRLHDNLAAGISLDLAFNHNLVTNVVLSHNDLGIFMRYSRSNHFKHVTISNSHHHGVFMAQVATPAHRGWRVCPETQCVGNSFENLVVLDCGGDGFKVNDASCTNNMILGGTFLHNIEGGVNQPATNPVVIREVAVR